MLSDIIGFISGKPAEYTSYTEILSKNEGREVTRAVSAGIIKV